MPPKPKPTTYVITRGGLRLVFAIQSISPPDPRDGTRRVRMACTVGNPAGGPGSSRVIQVGGGIARDPADVTADRLSPVFDERPWVFGSQWAAPSPREVVEFIPFDADDGSAMGDVEGFGWAVGWDADEAWSDLVGLVRAASVECWRRWRNAGGDVGEWEGGEGGDGYGQGEE